MKKLCDSDHPQIKDFAQKLTQPHHDDAGKIKAVFMFVRDHIKYGLTKNGDMDKALWDARMALHNYPSFVSAIELKEKILGRRDWEDEGTASRDFIHQLIREEHGIDEADFGRPAPPFVSPFLPPAEGESETLDEPGAHEGGVSNDAR